MSKAIYNMFSQIKNAQINQKSVIFIKTQKQCQQLLNLLWVNGFIIGYKFINNKIKIFLKYTNNQPVINNLKFISKPSRKIYFSNYKLWKIDATKFFLIISTSRGFLTLFECKKQSLGGELVVVLN